MVTGTASTIRTTSARTHRQVQPFKQMDAPTETGTDLIPTLRSVVEPTPTTPPACQPTSTAMVRAMRLTSIRTVTVTWTLMKSWREPTRSTPHPCPPMPCLPVRFTIPWKSMASQPPSRATLPSLHSQAQRPRRRQRHGAPNRRGPKEDYITAHCIDPDGDDITVTVNDVTMGPIACWSHHRDR